MKIQDLSEMRDEMIQHHLVSRGISDTRVLDAMRDVPREAFVPERLHEFSYEDTPLPIDEEQTISQPYIVALMAETLELSENDRVLEVGTGSGYAAAILSRLVREIYTIERYKSLANQSAKKLRDLGYYNVHVLHGDGTLGWPEHAPYDAIVVAAGGPDIPQPLLDQLAIGGRLVMPTGSTSRMQDLIRVRKTGQNQFEKEVLGSVRFVPLIGAMGWEEERVEMRSKAALRPPSLPELIYRASEYIPSIDSVNLDRLMKRIGDARVVLLGEATHGTAEFYDMRTRITQELIQKKGFNLIAVEADWPDASHLNHYIQGAQSQESVLKPFQRFPTWMWSNIQVLNLVNWLKDYNEYVSDQKRKVSFFGLDLYSLYSSIQEVLNYLQGVDPETAKVAIKRYGCLSPWEKDPATYGMAAITGRYKECEEEVVAMLKDLMSKRMEYAARDGQPFFNALQNARLVQNAERYYRIMYYGSRSSWNLRDSHMFETLQAILEHAGPDSRAVVWEHNSHIGDASATEMGSNRGEHNVGQLSREKFGDQAYLVGFGTDHGTVAAADDWNEPMQIMDVRPSHPDSYEHLCHESTNPAFLLPLRHDPAREEVQKQLMKTRLERAIGVVYRPETELQSHYFYATLPKQFDEYIWFDETHAVTEIGPEHRAGVPETFPFGL